MSHTTRTDVADASASSPASAAIGKVVVVAGSGREATAHSRALLGVIRELARDIVLVTGQGASQSKSPGASGDGLDTSDVGAVALDCETPWRNPLQKGAEAWKLARALEAECPDVVHIIGLRPAALASIALQMVPARSTVVHLPDLGPLEPRSGGLGWPYRKAALRLLAALLRKPGAFLLTASDDDLGRLRALGIDPGPRFAVLAGAGVDPEVFPVLPPSPGKMPVAAFVGPVTEANGVGTLMQAFERLWARGLHLQLEFHGTPGGNALAHAWTKWGLHPGVRCTPDWPADAREVWRRAEICVWPVATRQGLPRALLEAAACGRALIVSDAPGGGRTFARHETEGLVVPVGDADTLGAALERLARDAGLRQRMGAAARLRVLQGFTEAHVQETLRGVYLSLLAAGHHW